AYVSARHAEDFQAVCIAFGVTKPVVVGWYALEASTCLFISDLLNFGPWATSSYLTSCLVRYRTLPVVGSPYDQRNPMALHGSGNSHTLFYQDSSSVLLFRLPSFQNALQELVSAFSSPGYIAKVPLEERCAWIGSATSMVSM
ncbi:hypothetical protein IW261DRAFT_1343731, partial [Armillaria novae-zelandiae]